MVLLETSNENSLRSEEIAEYLYKHIEDEGVVSIAEELGLQRVKRGKKYYYRRKPERLTGKSLESAVNFGAVNKALGGKYGGQKIQYKGRIIPLEIFIAAKAVEGKKFVETPNSYIEGVSKIEKLLKEATQETI